MLRTVLWCLPPLFVALDYSLNVDYPSEQRDNEFSPREGNHLEIPQRESPPVFISSEYPNRLTDQLFGNAPFRDTAKCYSCMSKFYEAVWPALQNVYKKPMNFTDNCNDENIDKRLVPVTHCPTICVAMSEESTVAGVKIRGFIRGCLDDLLHNGFNQTIVAWYRWMHRDSCRIYRKRELFKLSAELSDESSIQVCTCYSDFCNAASYGSVANANTVILMVALFVIAKFY